MRTLVERLVGGRASLSHRWVPVGRNANGRRRGPYAFLTHAVPLGSGWLVATCTEDGQNSSCALVRLADDGRFDSAAVPMTLFAENLSAVDGRIAVPCEGGVAVLEDGGATSWYPLVDDAAASGDEDDDEEDDDEEDDDDDEDGYRNGEVKSVALFPDGRQIVGTVWGDNDGAVVVWRDSTRPPITLEGVPPGQVTSVAVSPDGQELAVAVCTAGVARFDANTLRPLGLVELQTHMLYELAYAPDGGQLAVTGTDGAVFIVDRRTGAAARLVGHEPVPVMGLAYSPDGAFIATSANKQLIIWSASDGRELGRVETSHLVAQLGELPPAPLAYPGDEPDVERGGGVAVLRWERDALVLGLSEGRLITIRGDG